MQKRKALDQHLNFLVSKADKLSTILHESLGNTAELKLPTKGGKKVLKKSTLLSIENGEDAQDEEDYEAESSEDDETTITKEEKCQSLIDQQLEMEELNKEADMEIDDLLSSVCSFAY